MTSQNSWTSPFALGADAPRDSLRDNPKERDQLTRIFNTAMIAASAEGEQEFSKRLQALVSTPAFLAILHAMKHLAQSEGISEKEAAESIIATFKQLETVWKDYVYLEGVQRLRGSKS